jgi:hypothetical protein
MSIPLSTDPNTTAEFIGTHGERVIVRPLNTSYEHHLLFKAGSTPEAGKHVRGLFRGVARKVYGVPSGGAFVTPILGTPRIVQGRVVSVRERQLAVQAAGVWVIDLPADASAIDLAHGPVAEGDMVNVVLLPGAWFEAA